MFNSNTKIRGSIALSTMLLSIGVASAANLPSDESIDSGPAKEFVQAQDQAQYRHEEQLRRQRESASNGESIAPHRRQAQSNEQERRKAQTRWEHHSNLPGQDQKSMAKGGGRR